MKVLEFTWGRKGGGIEIQETERNIDGCIKRREERENERSQIDVKKLREQRDEESFALISSLGSEWWDRVHRKRQGNEK